MLKMNPNPEKTCLFPRGKGHPSALIADRGG